MRVAIAGLGTVGVGVIKIIQAQQKQIQLRTGVHLEIAAVSAQSRDKNRGVDLSSYAWEDDPISLAQREDIDMYLELIGGEDGVAKASIQAAIAAKKHVVTANKALLAHHGTMLAQKAEEAHIALKFEAAIAGGIPIVKSLQEGLAANKITRILGVMNGSCNYILTRMEDAGLPYETVFNEADSLGYLEAEPNLDVGGIDAAHKLALLSSLAYGTEVDYLGVKTTGIQNITIEDITSARNMGYSIKLLGLSEMTDDGLSQIMEPCLIPHRSTIAHLKGGMNALMIEGDCVETLTLKGPGAGEGPTASAVMSDVIDIICGSLRPVFGIPAHNLRKINASPHSKTKTPYYIRALVKDTSGVLASIAQILGEADISINRMRQPTHEAGEATMVIVTHPTLRSKIADVSEKISQSDYVLSTPVFLPIVELDV